jgi:multidrug efflux pump subunit AcrA (membrane-fusion protein)
MPFLRYRLLLVAPLLAALVACGAPPEAELPTPTPLPPDPAIERPTYTVTRGSIERMLEATARATPVQSAQVAFRRDGRVNKLFFNRGDTVQEGDVIAELQQDEALDDLQRARDDVVQAQRDLENARTAQAKEIKARELDVERARADLARLLPGGEADLVREAQRKLDEATREAKTTGDDRSWAKTTAEDALRSRAEALQDAQKTYSTAQWYLEWVERYGTHPTERVPDPNNPERLIPRKLSDEEKQKFRDDLVTAERGLRAAERGVEEAQRALDKAREDEVVANTQAGEKVQDAQRTLDNLLHGKNSKELDDARRAVEQAQLALDEAQQKTLNGEIRAVENAQRALDRAERKVADGRVIAPQAGQITSIALEEGASVTAFEPVVEVADVSQLEFAATLNGEQMRQLTEGQPVEIRLLTRPDIALAGTIRRLPAPYGSGGSGGVQDRDQLTHFDVADLQGQELRAGATLAKVSIVLEHKDGVLLLPPEAIRTFEGRTFVIVREGEGERRTTVRVGIVTDTQLEIAEGLQEGDVVVGQ